MKKIAIVTLAVAFDGEKGYSRFRTLAELLSEKYEVDLITSTFQHWEKKQRDKEKIKALTCKFNIILADEPGYKKNVDIKRIFSHRLVCKNIKKLLAFKRYDLIYCVIPDNHIAASVGEIADKNGIPFIVDIEDLWPEAMEMVLPLPKALNGILFAAYRKNALKAYKYACGFVGTSDEYRDVPERKYGITGKPAVTVYVGCELDDFDLGVKEHIDSIEKDNNEFWVTYAGNFGSSYDIPTMLKAAQEIYSENKRIKFKLLGGGPLENEFKSIAEEKPCNADFVGYIPYRKMAAYLARSDILVNSFVKKAPQSIVTKIGDYLAAGKPMINTLSSPEFRTKVIKDGFGLNVEGENVSELKSAILELYNDSSKRELMGKRAREICAVEFDRKASYRKIENLIDKFIEKEA